MLLNALLTISFLQPRFSGAFSFREDPPHRNLLFGSHRLPNCSSVLHKKDFSRSRERKFRTSIAEIDSQNTSRRDYLKATFAFLLGHSMNYPSSSLADDSVTVQTDYKNPNIPASPKESSGLVVLRVAEVAQFQEKIMRAAAKGLLGPETTVSPQQIAFGTKILLRNSNIDGNMKLMISSEIPREKRDDAAANAAAAMNTLQDIYLTAASIERPFETPEFEMIADKYLKLRVQLNELYEYLPDREKAKYYGYFVKVTEYEKKIADGTYNPELDGILRLD